MVGFFGYELLNNLIGVKLPQTERVSIFQREYFINLKLKLV